MTARPLPQRMGHFAPMGSLLKRSGMVRRQADRATAALSDYAHLSAVRQCPCIKCGMEPAGEAAHVRQNSASFGKRQAIGTKPHDSWTLPVCSACHRTDPDSIHKVGEVNFFAALGINPFLLCCGLYSVSPDVVRMRAVVLSAIAERGA